MSETKLVRGISKFDLTAITINSIIGAGIFGLPSKVAALIGGYSLLAFVVCAVFVAPVVCPECRALLNRAKLSVNLDRERPVATVKCPAKSEKRPAGFLKLPRPNALAKGYLARISANNSG